MLLQADFENQANQLVALETTVRALHSKLEDVFSHVAKLEVKTEKAMTDFRKTTNAFLSELISTVGSQFDRMQAQLLESQQLQIKVTSLTSLHICTPESDPLAAPHQA